ncbi:MAG TPA: cyclase family protein [Clostridia bacterium]|nr:cyclase family protein [Clostridia bacterium]
MNLIDISRDTIASPVYPGDPETVVERVREIAGGHDCNLSAVFSCVHTGTHADAPLHFLEEGDSIDKIPPAVYIGPCMVIEVDQNLITGEYVNSNFPHPCERLLIKGKGRAFFMDSAAEEAAALGIRLIGTDANSIGYKGNQIKPHKAFLGKGVAVLEGLDLSAVSPGNYFLIAPPVKLGGLEAAPVRALLITDYIFWSAKQ